MLQRAVSLHHYACTNQHGMLHTFAPHLQLNGYTEMREVSGQASTYPMTHAAFQASNVVIHTEDALNQGAPCAQCPGTPRRWWPLTCPGPWPHTPSPSRLQCPARMRGHIWFQACLLACVFTAACPGRAMQRCQAHPACPRSRRWPPFMRSPLLPLTGSAGELK